MKVQVFGSSEAAQAERDAILERSDRLIRPWQREMKAGDYFMGLTAGLTVFGIILEEESEPKRWNFRSCRTYCTSSPIEGFSFGSDGSIHIAVFTSRLTLEQFGLAEKHNWDIKILAAEYPEVFGQPAESISRQH